MTRSIISGGLVLALMIVLGAGLCLACAQSSPSSHECCPQSSKSHCPMPAKNTNHRHCSLASDLPAADHIAAFSSYEPAAQIGPAVQQLPQLPAAHVSVTLKIPHSPPDRCLLNSVLLI